MLQEPSADTVPEMSFWWALLSNRGQRGYAAIAGILARHIALLAGVLFLHWSARKFLMIAMINFAWNWVLLGVWRISTAQLVESRRSGTPVSTGTWVLLAAGAPIMLCVIGWSLGFPVYFVESGPLVLDAIWWCGLTMTLLGPLPELVAQVRAGVACDLTREQIDAIAEQRGRLIRVGIVPIVGAYGILANLPYPIVVRAVAVGYVLFSALCELRPDLKAEFARELPP